MDLLLNKHRVSELFINQTVSRTFFEIYLKQIFYTKKYYTMSKVYLMPKNVPIRKILQKCI